jgi:hypothetical protein
MQYLHSFGLFTRFVSTLGFRIKQSQLATGVASYFTKSNDMSIWPSLSSQLDRQAGSNSFILLVATYIPLYDLKALWLESLSKWRDSTSNLKLRLLSWWTSRAFASGWKTARETWKHCQQDERLEDSSHDKIKQYCQGARQMVEGNGRQLLLGDFPYPINAAIINDSLLQLIGMRGRWHLLLGTRD